MLASKNSILVLFVALTTLLWMCSPDVQALTIAYDGSPRMVIVVDADAPLADKHAAAELAAFLQKISGARFRLVNLTTGSDNRILVGKLAVQKAYPDFSTADLSPDGIIVRTRNNDLILAGDPPRGTIYAVYTFLEDQLGCRWWSSKADFIPKNPTIVIEDLDIRYVPPLEFRSVFWLDAFDGNWAVRNKCNGYGHQLSAEQGGLHVYEGHVHTFYKLLPPEKYFSEHPEWFSEIDGKRTFERAQLCLTNEDMRRELIKILKQRLRNNPAATIASVSQNDWQGNCQCPLCKAVEEEEESPAGLLLRFVNKVAEDIEPEFPEVAISTLAYQYTRKPPKCVKPRPNVIVRLCSIECSFSKPLSDDVNESFRDDIVGWSKICNRLYIWDYTTNFRHYFRPHPNLRVLAPNIRFFVDHGVKGVLEQGAHTTLGAEMAELRAWVLAKLLWNPSLDDQKLIDEFLKGYYGLAGYHIGNYLKVIHDAVEQTDDYLKCLPPYTFVPEFLSFDTLNKGWTHLQSAASSVSDNPELLNRVKIAQLPVLYAFLRQWKNLKEQARILSAPWPLPDSPETVYNQFIEVARKNGVTRVNEWYDGYGLVDEALEKARQTPSTPAQDESRSP